MADSDADQIAKLEEARHLVLSDATHYSQIIPGILPIIGAGAQLEIRRWGADFLAEAFASPALAPQPKEYLSIQVLQTLKELLEVQKVDEGVVKSVVQAAASIYGLVFRYITNNPKDSETWDCMVAIKLNILKRWDSAAPGIKICCIKFAQRVVQIQTPGIIADPRRPEQNEISLALVPRNHPLIPPPNLEAEASGLLDRLLNVFFEEQSDAVLVNATMNCLGVLVRTRQSIANKIVSTVLNFNPLKQASGSMSPQTKVQIKSMEKTTRVFLLNVYRRNETGPHAARIKQHVERMTQSRMELFDEGSRKRGAPTDTSLESTKRVRLESGFSSAMPPGPTSIAQLFTLTSEEGLRSFDITALPIDLVVRIALPVLQRIDLALLDQAINNVRARYLELGRTQQALVQSQSHPPALIQVDPAFDEEDEDYEPDFEPTEDHEQIINAADALHINGRQPPAIDLALGPFKLPQPPPLTEEEAEQLGKGTISRVFSMMSILEEPSKVPKAGLNRLAGSNYDKEAWITVIIRLATRASAGLELTSNKEANNEASKEMIIANQDGHNLSDGIRETLWKYIVEDFRARIPIAIAWLNEEWYNDRMAQPSIINSRTQNGYALSETPTFEKWVLKLLDAIIPYLDAKDKVLIRFLSEIPGISVAVLGRIKGIARDPDRVTLAVNAIYYLVLLRPPVRELALDAIEDLWRNYDDAKAATKKLLMKWRPELLEVKPAKEEEEAAEEVVVEDKITNGVLLEEKEGSSTSMQTLPAAVTESGEGGSSSDTS